MLQSFQLDYPNHEVRLGMVKVGINFDSDKRTIGDWKIVEC